MKKYLLLILSIVCANIHAQNINGVINIYSNVTAIGGANVTVGSSAGFAIGDKIMVIQMKGATVNNANNATFGNINALNTAGQFETRTITAIAGNVITANAALVNVYDIANGFVQMVRVPSYCQPVVNNTLTCSAWNGSTGGVLAFDAGTLTLNSDINVTALGFRGGTFTSNFFCCSSNMFAGPTNGGQKGESISNWLVGLDRHKGKQANGGGGGNCGNSGGGGGGNAGTGGLGGNQYNGCGGFDDRGIGGLSLAPALNTMFMGGGGGGGFRDNGQVATNGANGGGIIYITANVIICNNRIIASNGGSVAVIANDEASGGGGAGGSVYVSCNNYTGNLTVQTNGGRGGSNFNTIFTNMCHGPGGGGGGGTFAFSPAALPGNITYISNGGAAGTVNNPASSCFNTTFGATPGLPGTTLANLPTSLMAFGLPTITVVGNNSVCAGATTTLTASGATTYTWSTGSIVASTTVAPLVQTEYTVSGSIGSCSAQAITTVYINPDPIITISGNTVICPGQTSILTAAGAATYTWSTNAQGNSISVTPNVNSTYSVTGTNILGCSASAVSDVSIVVTSPVMAFGTANVCQYGSATFSATAVGASGYQWFGPNGFTSTLQINTINNIQPVSSGNYSVNALFVLNTTTCTTSSFYPINVVSVPSLAVIPSITVCERQGASFSANAPNAQNYMWSGPNSFTMNSPNPTFANLTPSMSGIYTVTASFSNGNLTCFNSNQTSLLVKPILPFSLGADQTFCSNSDLFLNGPAGASAYNWWGSTSYTSNTQALFVPGLSPANSGIYVLEVDLNGCKTYDSVNVKVISAIVFTLAPSNQSVCRGDKVSIVVGAAQGSENYAYTWNPAIYISSPTGSFQVAEPLGTTVYNISAYDIACPNYVIQTSFTLNVKQPPVPTISIPLNNVCEPLCALFNTNTRSEASNVIYNFGNNNIVEGDSVIVCLNAGNHYMSIVTTGTNGCKGVFNYTVPITVYPKPGADFTWNPETPNTSNNLVTFIPTTKFGTSFIYNWQFTNSTNVGGITSSTLKNPTKDYDNNGEFLVMLAITNEYNCVDTVFKVITIEEDVNVYIPNTFTPNNDNINDVFIVKGIGLKAEGFLMQIFDRWGTLVYTTKDINKGWDGTVKGLRAEDGVYVYQVKVIGENGVGKKEFKGHVTLLK